MALAAAGLLGLLIKLAPAIYSGARNLWEQKDAPKIPGKEYTYITDPRELQQRNSLYKEMQLEKLRKLLGGSDDDDIYIDPY